MRAIAYLLSLAGAAWVSGLILFIGQIPQENAQPASSGEGAVVYTGGGGARIAAAMALLSEGDAERLLISGVNPETSKERLSQLWSGSSELFSCCVDLGHEARTTKGNADEAAAWARTHRFQSVVLVTSDFHMPRALAATRKRMPEARVTPFVVSSGYLGPDRRPVSLKAWREIAGEYTKFILAALASMLPTTQA